MFEVYFCKLLELWIELEVTIARLSHHDKKNEIRLSETMPIEAPIVCQSIHIGANYVYLVNCGFEELSI